MQVIITKAKNSIERINIYNIQTRNLCIDFSSLITANKKLRITVK